MRSQFGHLLQPCFFSVLSFQARVFGGLFSFKSLGFDTFGFDTFSFEAFGFEECRIGLLLHRQHHLRRGLRQAITQGDEFGREFGLHRHRLRFGLQPGYGFADLAGQAGKGSDTGRAQGQIGGDQALGPALGRTDRIGDLGHFGHREGTVHGVHGAQQIAVRHAAGGLVVGQPAIHRLQVAIDFHAQDFQQHRIDLHRHARRHGGTLPGFRLGRGCHLIGCRCQRVFGFDGLTRLRS